MGREVEALVTSHESANAAMQRLRDWLRPRVIPKP
jgi:hypothetical protein